MDPKRQARPILSPAAGQWLQSHGLRFVMQVLLVILGLGCSSPRIERGCFSSSLAQDGGTWASAATSEILRPSAGDAGSPGSPESLDRAPRKSSAPLVLIARLLNKGPDTPGCGIFHFVVVMRYEVVQVVEGAYGEREIYVAHGCPEMSRRKYQGVQAGDLEAFRVGELHRLALRQPRPSEAFTDSFRDKKLPRFVAARADLEPR
ncbi:MAG: hypothetical protein HY698_05465 [Deltaproteobacteria bacterium]|nr:hypothetical protein [Deltaproteobacteria bacterium]